MKKVPRKDMISIGIILRKEERSKTVKHLEKKTFLT